jgi:hypothetical protein
MKPWLLGISFIVSESYKTLENFTETVQSVKTILNLWSYRVLTYIGKVTVIKTLALPILVQSLTVLPNPPDSIFNDIEKIFYTFLWNGEKDKIERSIIINEYEEGGKLIPNNLNFLEKCHDKGLSGRSCSWQFRLKPSHIASVLSKLTHSPAHSENFLKTNND